MRARIENEVLFIHREDVPQYQKNGSVVRNSYFWALRSIAGRANFRYDWEFESEIWIALQRMLIAFAESSYLPTHQTQLEFTEPEAEIPSELRLVSVWAMVLEEEQSSE